MVKLDQPILVLVLLAVLAARGPVEGWYKQAAGPNYYSVGRAAGLLSGIRRSPLRRAELDPPENHLLPDTQLLHNEVLENTVSLQTSVLNLNQSLLKSSWSDLLSILEVYIAYPSHFMSHFCMVY